ncbi:MAG: hypothetical protein RQ862_01770 [Candidatus Caldarchaeales archaeon]|nr:hypothetical protein [Candidatus Caldarchaeales archaeon]
MSDIKQLIKMLRWHKQMLAKTRYVRARVRYNLDGEEYEVEFDTSEEDWHDEAVDLFFEHAEDFPEGVKDIAADVVERTRWFKIIPVSDEEEVTEDWIPEKAAGVTIGESKVFEVDGRKYRVEKDPHLHLSEEDVERLVRAGLFEMVADAWRIYEWEEK